MSIRTLEIDEGEPFEFTERVAKRDGTYPLKSEVHNISLQVFDESLGQGATVVFQLPSIDKEDAWFDTLQVDSYWDRDTTGYNFRHSYTDFDSEDAFEHGGKVYRLEYRIDFFDNAEGHKKVAGRVVVNGFGRDDRFV